MDIVSKFRASNPWADLDSRGVYELSLNSVERYLEEGGELSEEAYLAYLEEVGAKSVHVRMTVMRQLIEFARSEGVIEPAPLDGQADLELLFAYWRKQEPQNWWEWRDCLIFRLLAETDLNYAAMTRLKEIEFPTFDLSDSTTMVAAQYWSDKPYSKYLLVSKQGKKCTRSLLSMIIRDSIKAINPDSTITLDDIRRFYKLRGEELWQPMQK